ncbi:hypothetical protein [Nocardia sp. NPDC052316]
MIELRDLSASVLGFRASARRTPGEHPTAEKVRDDGEIAIITGEADVP